MQWSMDEAKSHVLLNKTRSEHFKSLPFADGEGQSTTETKYLGINITAQGIIPGLQTKKYHAEHKTLTQLKRSNLIITGIDPSLARLLYLSMIQSKLDYGSILTPLDGKGRMERARLDTSQICDWYQRSTIPIDKLREMFRTEAPYWRRRKICRGTARRLLGLGEAQPGEDEGSGQFRLQARRTLEALKVNSWFLSHLESPRSPECQEKEERRLVAFQKEMYSKWRRPFPMLTKRLPTCMELRSWRHRKLAVRWHLGNFPRHYRYLRKIGLQGLLDDLKVLSGSKASRGVNIRICAALAGITAIDEGKYSDRGVT